MILKKSIFLLLVFISAVLTLFSQNNSGEKKTNPKILIINSYHPGYQWSDNEQLGLLNILKNNFSDINLSIEYLDCKNFPGYEHFEILKNLFELKYKNKVNYVAALDNAALNFCIKYRKEIFPNVPIFFCGVNDFKISMLNGEKNITGLEGIYYNIRGTVGVISKLMPDLKELFIIHDYTETGLGFRKIAEEELIYYSEKINITYSPLCSLKELLEAISGLQKNSAILLLSFSRDKNGILINNDVTGEFISRTARVPVFGISHSEAESGIVGGYLSDSRMHGEALGKIIVDVISGKSINDFPIQKDFSSRPIFDYKQMKKFNLPYSKLPKNSIIINNPLEIISKYKYPLLFIFSIMFLLALIIIILLINIQFKRKAAKILHESEEKYRMLFELESDALLLTDNKTFKILAANPSASELYGYTISELLKMKNLELSGEPEKAIKFIKNNIDNVKKILFVPQRKQRKKNGEEIIVEIATTFFNLQGKNVQLAAMRDITQRIKMENQLKEINLKYEQILNNMNDMVCEIDTTGIYTFVNSKYKKILGFNSEDLIGKNALDFIHPDDINTAISNAAKIVDETSSSIDIWRYKNKKGEYKTLECRGNVRIDEKGNKKIVVISRDITEELSKEKALIRSERLLREAQKVAKIGYYVLNAQTGLWECSDMLYKIFGITNKYTKNVAGWIKLVHPDEKDEVLNYLENHVLKEKNKFDYEYRMIRHNDKKEIWVHGLGNLKFDDEGNVLEMFGTIQDVTERKVFEIELNKKTEELDRYFTNSLDLLCIADTDGYFRRLNPEWENTLGYPLSELEGKQFLTFVHPDDIQKTVESIKILSDQKEILNFTNRYRCKDGTYKWIEWRSFPEDKTIYAVARDVTLRKEAEEKIQKINQELEDRVKKRTFELENANKELEAFSYSVSHDLRSPLRAINGYSEILKQEFSKNLGDEGVRLCNVINENTKRMSNLIDDLLTFSRLSRSELQFTQINMNQLVDEVFAEIKNGEKNTKATFEKELLPDVFGDKPMITQVITNLISNAVKYSSKKDTPLIKFGFFDNQDENIFYVKDNGIGFNMQFVNKLFGVFQRLHNEKDFSGTGVGLAIVKRIIDKHSGRVWAESENDKGATFYFSLPKRIN